MVSPPVGALPFTHTLELLFTTLVYVYVCVCSASIAVLLTGHIQHSFPTTATHFPAAAVTSYVHRTTATAAFPVDGSTVAFDTRSETAMACFGS